VYPLLNSHLQWPKAPYDRLLRGCAFSYPAVADGSLLPIRAARKQSPAPQTSLRVAYDSCASTSSHSHQRRSQSPTAAWC